MLPNDTVISSASVLRYPVPPSVMMMSEIESFVRTTCAVAPDPLPPSNDTTVELSYPLPPFWIEIELML